MAAARTANDVVAFATSAPTPVNDSQKPRVSSRSRWGGNIWQCHNRTKDKAATMETCTTRDAMPR